MDSSLNRSCQLATDVTVVSPKNHIVFCNLFSSQQCTVNTKQLGQVGRTVVHIRLYETVLNSEHCHINHSSSGVNQVLLIGVHMSATESVIRLSIVDAQVAAMVSDRFVYMTPLYGRAIPSRIPTIVIIFTSYAKGSLESAPTAQKENINICRSFIKSDRGIQAMYGWTISELNGPIIN